MLQEVPLVLRLNPADDVVIARRQLVSGTLVKSEGVTVIGLVPPGHKLATRAIAAGSPVRRYNQIIGFATRDIRAGEHVHLHNMGIGSEHGANVGGAARDYAFCADVKPVTMANPPATFHGHRARRWPSRNAQLCRDHLERQLFGDRLARDCGSVPHRYPTGSARRLSKHRRCDRADAWHRLRHGHGREHGCAAPDDGRLRAPSRILRRRSLSASVARRTRSRRCSAPKV